MAGLTSRFALNFFGQDTPGTLDEDSDKYTFEDRLTIDRVLAALENHNHRVVSALDVPDNEPDLQLGSVGVLDAGSTYYYVVSFINADGLETVTGPEASIDTPPLLPTPEAPTGETNIGGTLGFGVYYYALTGLSGTQESPLGEPTSLTVITGPAPPEQLVTLTLPPLDTATSYQVWRMKDTDPGYTRIATTTSTTFIDDGSVPAGVYGDPANMAPLVSTGIDDISITVTLTGADITSLGAASGWRIYRTVISGVYSSASLVHEVIERVVEDDPTSALMTSWIDDGDAMLTGSPNLFTTELSIPPFTFENATAALPPASGYPDYYPIIDSTGTLYYALAGTWMVLSGGMGPTGATGPTGVGATGATGASGTGSAGSSPTPYDTSGLSTYHAGDEVLTSTGLYLALLDSTGISPESDDPTAVPDLGASTIFSASPPAAHDRLSRRFQVSTSILLAGLRLGFAEDYAGGASVDISSTDPATTFTSIATMTLPGGTATHEESATFTTAVTLDAATDYWIVIGADAGQHVRWVVTGGFNTLSGVVSDTGNTRYSDAVTGVGTTATADTHQIGFALLGNPVQYWRLLAPAGALSYISSSGTGFDWVSASYTPGAIVRHNNALWVQTWPAQTFGIEPTPTAYQWLFLAWIVPPGGSTGQILSKVSDADGDVAWVSP